MTFGTTMRVTFPNVLRSTPIVLTRHDILCLSQHAGRDVRTGLESICNERFEVKTWGQLMRMLKARFAPVDTGR